MDNTLEICLEIRHETDKAYLVTDNDGDTSHWLPKSQVQTEEDCGIGDTTVFTIPEWLALEKVFI